MFNFYPESDILTIIDRRDSTTLWDWSRNKGWFPPASFPGRPPRWTERTVSRWIEEIPKLFEKGAGIPELATPESALAYQAACRDRLQALQEKRQRQAAIVKVYRTIPQTA